jgi:hypothetical protein
MQDLRASIGLDVLPGVSKLRSVAIMPRLRLRGR